MYGMNYGNVTTLTFAQLQDAFVNGTVSQKVFDAEVDRRDGQSTGIGWSNVANVLALLTRDTSDDPKGKALFTLPVTTAVKPGPSTEDIVKWAAIGLGSVIFLGVIAMAATRGKR